MPFVTFKANTFYFDILLTALLKMINPNISTNEVNISALKVNKKLIEIYLVCNRRI